MRSRSALSLLVALAGLATAAPEADGRWPVAPKAQQHPIWSSFLDPRGPEYHWGVDIAVRDDRPERGHPAGRSHRVYAVGGGEAANVIDGRSVRCVDRSLDVGRFAYWHVDAVVRPGLRIRPGQMIGWTCTHVWHVHLGERSGGWVNPLRRGGSLRPYSDSLPPAIHAIRFNRPDGGSRLEATSLHGRVDVRAWIGDRQSFRGWMINELAFLSNELHPYRVQVTLTRASTGALILSHEVFRADRLPRIPLRRHYAPETRRISIIRCVKDQGHLRPNACRTERWFRLFARQTGGVWNTRIVANGAYRLRVTAWDTHGNHSTSAVVVKVRN